MLPKLRIQIRFAAALFLLAIAVAAAPQGKLPPEKGQVVVLGTAQDEPVYERLLFTPDSKRLMVTGKERSVRLWEVGAWKMAAEFKLDGMGSAAEPSLSADGHYAAVSKMGMRIYDLATLKPQSSVKFSGFARILSPDGGKLFGYDSPEGKLRIVDVGTGKTIVEEPQNSQRSTVAAWSPDGKLIVGSDWTNKGWVRVYDAATLKPLRTLGEEKVGSGTSSIRFSPDSRTVYALRGNAIAWWDAESGKELGRVAVTMPRQQDWFSVSGDGRLLAGYVGEALCLLDAKGTKLAEVCKRSDGPLAPHTFELSPDGKWLAISFSGSAKPGIVIYDVKQLVGEMPK